MNEKLNIAVIGASGYTGSEAVRILLNHKHANIKYLTGDSQAGKSYAQVYPYLAKYDLPDLVKIDDVDFDGVDVVFCCLPHGTSQAVIKELPEHLKVIDLSADFRLQSIATYEATYGTHQAPELQETAVYGLSEIFADDVKTASLVACPGCYPTSALLPLWPIMDLVEKDSIIIDSKSGVSGAGRKVAQNFLFTETNENMYAYAIGSHRHAPEIAEKLNARVTFTPHLIPINRGIISTIYVNGDAAEIKEQLPGFYEGAKFVHMARAGIMPQIAQVKGTNDCVIGVYENPSTGGSIIVSVIDNLVKGSSGQAVQNMNLMFGFAEDEGLKQAPVFP